MDKDCCQVGPLLNPDFHHVIANPPRFDLKVCIQRIRKAIDISGFENSAHSLTANVFVNDHKFCRRVSTDLMNNLLQRFSG